MSVQSEILDELKRVNMRATVPRVKVLEIFRSEEKRKANRKSAARSEPVHFSVDELFRRLVENKIDVGLATVYRVLQQFEKVGILCSTRFDSERVVYEINEGRQHDHIVCLSCGRVDEFFDPTIAARQKAMAEELGYLIANHQLAIYGYCTNCRPKPEAKKTPPKR